MNLLFDGDVYSTNEDGACLLAKQAGKAKTSVQVASMDGSSPSWVPLTEPGLLVVSRGKAIRLSGDELDALIAVCKRHGVFCLGQSRQHGEDQTTSRRMFSAEADAPTS
jgi:hypothetical protein